MKSLFASAMSFLKSSFNYWGMFAVCNIMLFMLAGRLSCQSRDFPHAHRFQSENYGGFGHVIRPSLWLIGRWERRPTWHRALRAPRELYTELCICMGAKSSALPATCEKEGQTKLELRSILTFPINPRSFFCVGCHTKVLGHFFLISWVSEIEIARSSHCSRNVVFLPRQARSTISSAIIIYSSLQ